MRTRVQKWGNSLALRIPKAMAIEAQIAQNSAVEVSVVDGKLVVAAVTDSQVALEQLLAGVTDENLHAEFDFGEAVGAEAW
jgi:antitoxin MazE